MSNDLKYYGSVSLVVLCAFIGIAIVPNTALSEVVKNTLYAGLFAAAVFFAVCAVRAALVDQKLPKSLKQPEPPTRAPEAKKPGIDKKV